MRHAIVRVRRWVVVDHYWGSVIASGGQTGLAFNLIVVKTVPIG